MSEFTVYLRDHLQFLLAKLGINEALAIRESRRFVSDVTRNFAGEKIHITNKCKVDEIARNMAIIRDFKAGDKVHILVERYHLSRSTIYRKIKG